MPFRNCLTSCSSSGNCWSRKTFLPLNVYSIKFYVMVSLVSYSVLFFFLNYTLIKFLIPVMAGV